MFAFIIFLLIVWVVFAVLGFVIKGLFWMAVVGVVLFIATAIWLALSRRRSAN